MSRHWPICLLCVCTCLPLPWPLHSSLAHLTELSLSPDPSFPPRHPLQRRAFQPIAYRESAYTPSATFSPPPRRHPGAGPSRHPGTDAIDAPTRPTTTAATNSRSSPCLNVHHLEMVVFFVSVFFVSAIKDMGYVGKRGFEYLMRRGFWLGAGESLSFRRIIFVKLIEIERDFASIFSVMGITIRVFRLGFWNKE